MVVFPSGPRPGPRLRPLDAQWVQIDGEPRLRLQDPLLISDRLALIPAPLAPLLPLLDGTRTLAELERDFARATSVSLPGGLTAAVVQALDEALLLDGARFHQALGEATVSFRRAPFRPPALAGISYPAEPDALQAVLDSYLTTTGAVRSLGWGVPAGVLSPHIDFARGGPVYAATWAACTTALAACDVVVVFGTDHRGAAGRLTPTPQRYATPWGTFPVDEAAVSAVAAPFGAAAFEDELHHRREHSIELAAVWLHWALRRAGRAGRAGEALPALVPVLCGSFHCYVAPPSPDSETAGRIKSYPGAARHPSDEAGERAVAALAQALAGRRVFVVAAADLAHVGPEFGDDAPLTAAEKRAVRDNDACLLAAASEGDADQWLAALRAQRDRTRVCGLPPVYWAMRLLSLLRDGVEIDGGPGARRGREGERRPVHGRTVAYAQCAADAHYNSLVSIAGMLWE